MRITLFGSSTFMRNPCKITILINYSKYRPFHKLYSNQIPKVNVMIFKPWLNYKNNKFNKIDFDSENFSQLMFNLLEISMRPNYIKYFKTKLFVKLKFLQFKKKYVSNFYSWFE